MLASLPIAPYIRAKWLKDGEAKFSYNKKEPIGTDKNFQIRLDLIPSTDGCVVAKSSAGNDSKCEPVTIAAANAETQAITAKNTAVTASNTAATATAQYADTVLKAQADCLTQQATILKAGGTPLITCN